MNMKKILRSFLLVFLVFVSTLRVSAKDIEDISGKTYPEMFEPLVSKVVCIKDNSYSMSTTFCWEQAQIYTKLDTVKFHSTVEFGNNSKTPLWENINKYSSQYDNILLVSDLWNTIGANLQPADKKVLCVLVPYNSTFSEGVSHIDKVVNEILSVWTNSFVRVVYMDDIMHTFTSGNIYPTNPVVKAPIQDDEKAADIAAIAISEDVSKDKFNNTDSIVVFDLSGSMADFQQLLYEQLEEMTAIQHIDAMYAFAEFVSDKINPSDFNSDLFNELSWILGASTNITGALEKVTTAHPSSHIYLVTDMLNNHNEWTENNFDGEISVLRYKDGYSSSDLAADYFLEKVKSNYPYLSSITMEAVN